MEVQAVSTFESIERFAPEVWNGLRGDPFPFSRHEHLRILEMTQCLGKRTGWFPTYVALGPRSDLQGVSMEPVRETPAASVAPPGSPVPSAVTWFYEKTNSYGEFVFDHEWADLHERMGRPYFPKAVSAIPFTPATGSKLFGKPENLRPLIEAVTGVTKRYGCSSFHELFLPASQKEVFVDLGFVLRTGIQFHWKNRDYRSFEEFLQRLKKKRRKEIVYERRNIDNDIEIRLLTGSDLTPEWADFAYTLYQKTNLEKMSFVCLTRAYFQELFSQMRSNVQFFVAVKRGEGRPVAGALFLAEGDAMFGRYWGALEDRRFLHFELCYYAPIESAIASKVQKLEAGAQGAHKISRGFLPTFTHSAHMFFESRIQAVFGEYCRHEALELRKELENFADHFPYQEGNEVGDAGDSQAQVPGRGLLT